MPNASAPAQQPAMVEGPQTANGEQPSLAEVATGAGSLAANESRASAAAETKSGELDAYKEAELEAVAAVDASIGFGMAGEYLFASTTDTCYDLYGNARYCEPEFENAAFEKQIEVSSVCGQPASRFCTAYLNERNDQIRNCHICDAQHPKKRHPAAYLTDMNNSNNPTCWVSAPIGVQGQQPADQQSGRLDNVTLTLNLDKKYEITYISMQFCSLKPDSLAILKSADFGRTWSPYQFYSSDCQRTYGPALAQHQAASRRTRAETGSGSGSGSGAGSGAGAGSERAGLGVAQCVAGSAPTTSGAGGQQQAGRISFLPLDGRAARVDRSAWLQDWITATNIRIVLDRHQANWIHSSTMVHPHPHQHRLHQQPAPRATSKPEAASNASSDSQVNPNQSAHGQELENSLISPSDTFNYAMSDLTVGGRCKCNGHASRCIHSAEGRLQCDCRHNTAGRDCERCAPFHFDRPWARATQLDANPCQPCNCNGHSRKCRFDSELYRLSGKRSGGVCIGCRDNTAGRHCHYCKEGFTRDHSRPMTDREACKHCDCHPIGSLGRVCNQTTGQCPCKEGVTGPQCNRCAPGYQQSSSLTEPCIKLPENDINYEPPTLTVGGADDTKTRQPSSPAHDNLAASDNASATGNQLDADQTEHQFRAPPGGEPRPKARPAEPPEDADKDPDKDDDDSDAGPDEQPAAGARARYAPSALWPQPHLRPAAPKHYYGPGAARYAGYNGLQARNRHQLVFGDQPAELADDDELAALAASRLRSQLDEDADYSGRLYPGAGSRPAYGVYGAKAARYGHGRRPARLRPGELAMAGDQLEPAEDLNLVEPDALYAPMYAANDDTSFNQIRTLASPTRHRPLHHQLHHQAAGRARSQPQSSMAAPIAELACADCQAGSRRLSFRQFCYLDYAIKASVVGKSMADDWTKFDVEIQDIFKSPSPETLVSGPRSSAPLQAPAGRSDYALDLDGRPFSQQMSNSLDTSNRTATSASNLVATEQQIGAAASGGVQRIKVGTIQSIWIPTEDLHCKCPKLKLRSTYLLMGSLEAKENLANLLQLDRHGVALEWKSGVQERLIKYQRRHSRGRC